MNTQSSKHVKAMQYSKDDIYEGVVLSLDGTLLVVSRITNDDIYFNYHDGRSCTCFTWDWVLSALNHPRAYWKMVSKPSLEFNYSIF